MLGKLAGFVSLKLYVDKAIEMGRQVGSQEGGGGILLQ